MVSKARSGANCALRSIDFPWFSLEVGNDCHPFLDGTDVAVNNVAARGGDNVIVRKFNHSLPMVASTHDGPQQEAPSCQAAGQPGQQPELREGAAVPATSRAPRAPSGHAAQAEPAVAAQRAQDSLRRQAEDHLEPQPGTFTPFEALQIVQAEFAVHGLVFAEPLEEVLADLGQKPEPDARQARLLAFIDSCEPRVEELLNQAVQSGADPEDLIALLSDGTVLPPYTNLVPRAEVAAEVAILLGQVHEPLLHNQWARPTPGILLAIVLFEGVQAVSVFPYSVYRDLGAQA